MIHPLFTSLDLYLSALNSPLSQHSKFQQCQKLDVLQRCHSFSHHITLNYWEALSTFGLEKIYSSFMIPLNIQLIQTRKNYAFFFFFYSQSPLLPSEMALLSSVSPLYLVQMFRLALATLSATQEAKSMLFVLAAEATRRHLNNKLNKRNESKTSSYLFQLLCFKKWCLAYNFRFRWFL